MGIVCGIKPARYIPTGFDILPCGNSICSFGTRGHLIRLAFGKPPFFSENGHPFVACATFPLIGEFHMGAPLQYNGCVWHYFQKQKKHNEILR